MDLSEQQGNEENVTEAAAAAQGPDEQETQAAPAKTPRTRRTASAPAGAPPAAPAQSPDTEPPAAPVRRRASRARKPVVTTEETPGAATPETATTGSMAAAEGAPDAPATTDIATDPPVRAPRTRRRAATAEAGPALGVETPVAEPITVEPAAEPVVPETAVASVPMIDAEPAPRTPARAPRTRRRAASLEAGPAGAVETPAVETPAIETPAIQSAAVRSPAAQSAAGSAVEPAASGESADAADDAAAADKPVRTRRTSRSRSLSETDPEQSGGAAQASGPEQAGGAAQARGAAQASGPEQASEPARVGSAAEAGDTLAEQTPSTQGTVPVAEQDSEDDEVAVQQSASENRFDPFAVPESPLSLLFHAPDLATVTVPSVKVAPPREEADEDETEESGRRSRRNRRSRNRTRSDANQDQSEAGGEDAESEGTDERTGGNGPEDGPDVTSRRRRRRRRGDQDLELNGGEDDDPPNTVTRVRAPRQSSEPVSDRVTSVRGSTRLEAKKQRRRESRDTGRRRQVITEAEFLARRESVDRQMVVRQRDDRIQIGVLEDGILSEHFVSRTQQDSLIGNVYLGKVQNVLPSMEAAFVDIGRGRNAVLYAGEVNWDAAGLDGQPRRIELALKSGDPVLVQVTKDPVGHKGARLTSQISLPGRYLVYVPGGSMTGISRKLPDVERNRLKRILKDRLPENAGVIVRTAAEGASEEELTHDINRLRAQWEEIERKAGSTKTLAPELLYGEPDLTIKVVRDVFNEDFSKLVVSGEDAWDTIEAYVMYVAPDLVGRLEKWTSGEDIFAASRIDEQISKALERKVFLPSGGSLVIDRTEAMTVVDVNTGKFTGSGGNLEETVTKNNLEAAEEVVRQLRLRDIGGIIVIDFIDMVLEANRDLVLRRLVECLGRDRTKHQVAEVTSLGLVQMTRKRMGTGLLEVFGEDCEHCAGRGVITHLEPVEHRRHTSDPDTQQQARQDKPSRSERKRNRGRGNPQQDEGSVQPPVPVVESPDRAAKAEAARAALASIAAATHHAHDAPTEQPAAEVDVHVTEAVLTINGETVTLPRAENRRQATEEPAEAPFTRLTLDSLSEAFNRKPASDDGARRDATTAPQATDGTAQDVLPQETSESAHFDTPAHRLRPRRRVARSAQGAADTTIETHGTEAMGEPSGTRHVAKAQPAARTAEVSTAEPLIFGVGVPASEL